MFRILLLGLLSAPALLAGELVPKKVTLKPADGEIRIDGIIEQEWNRADSVADFFQLQPFYAKPPTQRTVARVLTTSEALYCLLVCYDNRQGVEQITGVHDQSDGDVVSIMLDTFGDRQSAYKFAVSASGVQSDARMLDDARDRDYSWDGIWFAGSKVYDWGFVVEMRIPYRSIRYNAQLEEWGLDFDRWIPGTKEDLYWSTYEQNEGQRISKFGRLVLNGTRPSARGLNLEVYPVGLTRATWKGDGTYDVDPDAGIDVFYNPSERLTFQLTGNPDFAQIEADPFEFNISRYESYFSEQRPFFTEGSEVFMASGKQQSSGFYRPLELFYSRRIGKILPGNTLVPLYVGTKAFGRAADWEYGGFFAMTGETEYEQNGEKLIEPRASFGSARIKKRILENSSVGVLFVGKKTTNTLYGVLDIDGAFRGSDWQLAYQLARSVTNSQGDFAGSAGFMNFGETWVNAVRLRAVGKNFDISQVGFVPWRGTMELTTLTGPVWYYQTGAIRQIMLYGGFSLNYEDVDLYTDRSGLLGFNMQFRDNWGYEITLVLGKSRDQQKMYTSYEVDLSSWCNISPRWEAHLSGGYSRTYNFSRDYLAFYNWLNTEIEWKPLAQVQLGTSYNMWVEGNPGGQIEEITYNARPFFSFTPFNDLNFRVYVDNVFSRNADRLERVVFGFLLSYNFLPKSWIYLAINEVRDRSVAFDGAGSAIPMRMQTTDRAAVAKVKYLYYL
jgi:hypothetical protein